MNGDSAEIIKYIGEIHADLKEDIGKVTATVSGINAAFTTGLAATNHRVTELEKENERDEWKQWAERIFIVGGTMSVHKILTLFGIKI
jgi:hypothetical protein